MSSTATEPDLVWEGTRYDSGLYRCTVQRTGDTGQLSISLVGLFNDHVLHEEPVKLDRQDIDQWKRRCTTVISDPGLRSRQR